MAGLVVAPLLAGTLSACSSGPAPDVTFIPTSTAEAPPGSEAAFKAAFEAAKAACFQEARRKGISSVTRILLFRGKTSKSDYIECMERKGFTEVEG